MEKDYKIAIIGLGYVGLPLAIAFSKFYNVVGFDINKERIKNLQNNIDSNCDIDIQNQDNLKFTSIINDIKDSNIYIVTVPTPVTKDNTPDLTLLKSATKMLSTYINKGDIVIYESTVYPGVTEDICVPIIEKNSELIFRSSAIGFLSVFTGAIFYFMIFGGIVLWAADFSGPIGNDSFLSAKGLPGIILKNIYNLLFSLFGTYTNKICSIILFLLPPLSLWQFLKEHYSFN